MLLQNSPEFTSLKISLALLLLLLNFTPENTNWCYNQSMQSDGGGEFRPFTQHLTNLGILHRFTCPHTSYQNGAVERKHRQIVEIGLTLLAHASLPS